MRTFKFLFFCILLFSIIACNEDIDQLPISIYGTWESQHHQGQNEETIHSYSFLEDGTFEYAAFTRDIGSLEKVGYVIVTMGNFRIEDNILITFDQEVHASQGNELFVPREELVKLPDIWQEGRRPFLLENNNTRLILEVECLSDNCTPSSQIYVKVG